MKRKKRFVAMLLSLLMVFSICTSATYAEDETDNADSAVVDTVDVNSDDETDVIDDQTTETNVVTSTSDDSADIDETTTSVSASATVTNSLTATNDSSNSDEGIAVAAEDVSSELSLDNNTITIAEDGDYTITGSITLTEGIAAITVDAGVNANITLKDISIIVQGETGKHKAGIYLEDGSTATLTLEGINSIKGSDLPTITKDSSTDVIGIWIGGKPSDSSTSNGGTSLTINGNGSLAIEEVGTGISNTATNSLTISEATVTMNNIYMLDSTVSGMGIYNNGTLKVCDGATLDIRNINNDNLSGTYISYKNGYGIASQNEGGVEITGSGTTVSIYGAYLSGIYCSDKTDSETDNYLTVSDSAKLTIDGGSTSTASQHAGIKMESNGTISVTDGASIDISSVIYGIAVNANCLVEVDGESSQINIHDLATHGEKQNKEQGIYAGANTIINVKNKGDLSVEGANYAIVFEEGTSGNDGIFITDSGTLNISNSDLGIYVQGGTTSVEFTSKANVEIDVNSVAIGSDAIAPTGHILMSGDGTTVELNGGWVFSMNYKYLKISDYADVTVNATSEAISLGTWKNGGGSLIVTSNAKLDMNISGSYSGIATYNSNGHYVEFSDNAYVSITGGENSKGISITNPTTIYISDATLLVDNATGIVVTGEDNLLYEDSLSHIEASNIYTNNGSMDFIVMGGTLTYDFNHDDNVWPTNATDISIGDINENAYLVNDTAVTRSFEYYTDEALVNFIVPTDDEHLTFDAMYQTLETTYSYKSDADKEEDTLSIWVPGVEVYYNFDEDTDDVDTNLTGEYVSDLKDKGVDFVLQYESITEPYDMVIRGQSIAFSAESITDDEVTLMYARMKEENEDIKIIDHVLTDSDGIPALYTTAYTTSDNELYDIQWYYGNTDFTEDDLTTDNGPLATFDLNSNVKRVNTANVYGLLNEREIHVTYVWVSTDNPTDVTTPDDDTIKAHTAYDSTPQDETEQGYTFAGWYLDEECTISYEDGTVLTEDTTLYGKWIKVTSEETPTDPTTPTTPSEPEENTPSETITPSEPEESTPSETTTPTTSTETTPSTSTTETSANDATTETVETNVKTGDNANIALYALILIIAMFGIVTIRRTYKRKQ